MMKRFFSIVKRELKHFIFTPIAMLILFGGPLIFGLIIGLVYLNAKPLDLPIVVVDEDNTILSQNIIEALEENQFLKVIKVTPNEFEAQKYFRNQTVEGIVTIPSRFEADIQQKRNPEIDVNLNAINILTSNYINTGIIKTLSTINAGIEINSLQKKGMPNNTANDQFESFKINVDRYYNPESNYLRFLWPGITGTILQQIFLLVIAIIFAKEFEKNTFHEILKYSKSTTTILLAKSFPYLVMMTFIWIGMLYLMYPLFHIDIIGSFWVILTFSLLFILSLLFMGVMVSLLFPTQLLSTEILMIIASPSFIVSGYTWPVSQMPVFIQYIANALPLTHFLSGFRKIVFMGNNLLDVKSEIFALLILLLISITISWFSLNYKIKKDRKKEIQNQLNLW